MTPFLLELLIRQLWEDFGRGRSSIKHVISSIDHVYEVMTPRGIRIYKLSQIGDETVFMSCSFTEYHLQGALS